MGDTDLVGVVFGVIDVPSSLKQHRADQIVVTATYFRSTGVPSPSRTVRRTIGGGSIGRRS